MKPLNPLKHNNRKHLKLILANTDKQAKDDSIMEIKIGNGNHTETDEKNEKQKSQRTALLPQNNKVYQECSEKNDQQSLLKSEKFCNKSCQRLVQAMDLELLKDPAFWSIIIGMALVYTSTINFTMIFPSFLQVIIEGLKYITI